MELEVRDREKRVNIWLTHAESQDAGFMESLKPIYREYKAKKYLVGVFASGTEDLLRYNRVRLRELETKNEKAVGFER